MEERRLGRFHDTGGHDSNELACLTHQILGSAGKCHMAISFGYPQLGKIIWICLVHLNIGIRCRSCVNRWLKLHEICCIA